MTSRPRVSGDVSVSSAFYRANGTSDVRQASEVSRECRGPEPQFDRATLTFYNNESVSKRVTTIHPPLRNADQSQRATNVRPDHIREIPSREIPNYVRVPPRTQNTCNILRATLLGRALTAAENNPIQPDGLEFRYRSAQLQSTSSMARRTLSSNLELEPRTELQQLHAASPIKSESVSEPLDMRMNSPGKQSVAQPYCVNDVVTSCVKPQRRTAAVLEHASTLNDASNSRKRARSGHSPKRAKLQTSNNSLVNTMNSAPTSPAFSHPSNSYSLSPTPNCSSALPSHALSSCPPFQQTSSCSSYNLLPCSAPMVFTNINGVLVPMSTIQVIVVNNYSPLDQSTVLNNNKNNNNTAVNYAALTSTTPLGHSLPGDTVTCRLRPLAPAPPNSVSLEQSAAAQRSPLLALNQTHVPQNSSAHSRRKTYSCGHPDCDKTYFKNSHLKVHQRIHTGRSDKHLLLLLCCKLLTNFTSIFPRNTNRQSTSLLSAFIPKEEIEIAQCLPLGFLSISCMN